MQFDPEDPNTGLVVESAKRVGLIRYKDMGDWFAAFSPRAGSSCAEGFWIHWCNFAAFVLSHPATQKVAPHLYRPELPVEGNMDTYGPNLTAEDLELFDVTDIKPDDTDYELT